MPKLFFTFLLFTFCQLSAQSRKPLAGKEPSWITQTAIDYSNTSMDNDAEDGYADLDFEKQISLADQCVYIRKCVRIISEAGVQNESQVSVTFDPSFQQLTFHSIKIIRGGTAINQLQLSKIKTIQQENELDNFIYNGSLNAVLFLEDVRKGDIIEYSYSLKGFNPIFKGKYQDIYSLQYSSPLYQLYYKLIVPGGRTVNIKNTLDTIKPLVQTQPGATVYEWKRNNIKALHTQDYLPSWYEVFPDVMISEYNNWKEVNDWALSLFPKNINLPGALQQKIKEIQAANNTTESRVQAALRFVQDDIRYMGIEMGVHSHKPADPGKVFNQRFGDCKEKSYLLCCMLHAMGIEADPALINTDFKKSLHNWLPGPTDFNHMTVRVKIGNEYYWFDPTIAYQRGNIRDISYPDYQCGFVITDTTTSLTDIPFHEKGEVNTKEIFDIPDMYGHAKLTVTTTYSGSYADETRYDFKNSSNYEMLKNYKNFYAAYFEQITADSLVTADNDGTGIFTTKEYYSIDSLWSLDKGIKKASFTSFIVQSIIHKPKDQQRNMPFSLQFPAKYHEEIEINLPEEWNAKSSEENIHCSSFMLHSKFSSSYRQVLLDYDFENFKDHVMPDEAKDFFANLNKSNESQGYKLTYNEKKTSKPSASHTSKFIYILLGVLLLVISIVKISQGK